MAPNPGSSMLGEEGGGRPWLKRAFSMVDKENMGIDMTSKMDSIDKVKVQPAPDILHTHQATDMSSNKGSVDKVKVHLVPQLVFLHMPADSGYALAFLSPQAQALHNLAYTNRGEMHPFLVHIMQCQVSARRDMPAA